MRSSRALDLLGRLHQRAHRRAGAEGEQAAEHGPVGGHRALGVPGRAGGVEDRGVVVGLDGDLGQRGRRVEHLLEPVHARQVLGQAHPDDRQAETLPHGGEALGPLLVGEGDLGPAVLEAVLQLVGGPPGVEGHGHRPDGGDGLEGHDPLGVVAHGDGDPVAVAHAVAVVEQRTHGPDLGPHVGEREALVLVDEVVQVAVAAGQLEEEAQCRRGVGEDLVGPAVDGGVDQRVAAVGAGDLGHRLVPGQRSVGHRGAW